MKGRLLTRWRPTAIAAVAAGALAGGVIATAGRAEAEAVPPVAMEVRGEPVPVADRARSMFAELGYADLRLVATEGGHAYYTLRGARGVCYAVGFAHEIGMPGHVTCGGGRRPIVAFTYVEATRSEPELRVYRTEGIVADGIETIELVDESGRAVASAAVRDNVFQFGTVPKAAKRLVGRGRDGAVVAGTPLR